MLIKKRVPFVQSFKALKESVSNSGDAINKPTKISNFLNDSGFIFIEVPSVEKKNDYRQFKSVPHAYNYSKRSLINISKKANYKIIKCDYVRSPTLIEGGINKIFTTFLKRDFFKFYPKILTNSKKGENIRLILQKNPIN